MTTKMALYDEDYNGIVVETTDGHRFGWQVIKDEDGTVHLPRFTEENGTRFFTNRKRPIVNRLTKTEFLTAGRICTMR